jgi:hypothetical protein
VNKITRIAGMACIAFLLASCQNSENPATDQDSEPVDGNSQNEDISVETDENGNENSTNEDVEEESTNETPDNESDTYGRTEAATDYFIDSHTYSAETKFLTAFTIKREEDENTSPEERLRLSLIENDPSEQDILGSFSDISVDWPKLHVHFKEEGSQLSTTSAQMTLFYDSLVGISDLYGIEEIVFFNPDGEQNIIVAGRQVDAPIIIEEERGLPRGYYTIYNKDLQQTLFLPGRELGEKVAHENGEPLSFPETIEAMGTVDNDHAFYSSAIVEGLEVVNTSLENGIATIHYTFDDELVTEADRIVFTKAIQLAALDFDAEEVRLVNDTEQEIMTYPLMGE